MLSLEPSLVAYVAQRCEAEDVQVDYVGVADWALPEGDVTWSGDPCVPDATLTVTVADGASWTVKPVFRWVPSKGRPNQ
jgi:hypothetical protein